MAVASSDEPYSFESGHADLIHDVQIDFYGKTLATASSDRTIQIFEIINNSHRFLCKLSGHRGPVWKVSWAHPTYGRILASCGYDKQVIIWKESGSKWSQWFVDNAFNSSVNTVQFSPSSSSNNRLELIAGSSDGSIKIYALQNNKWSIHKVIKSAHNGGVNAISWSTPSIMASQNNKQQKNDASQRRECKRFVSGGCDNLVKIWNFEQKSNEYQICSELNEHDNWVRDVAWSPIPTSTSHSVIASCSEDQSVIIWKENNKKWSVGEKIMCDAKVWSVSWSELGNILAVAMGENKVELYKEGSDGKWQNVSKVN